MDKVHFSTGKDDWGTPQDLFDALNKEFCFTLDPCADDSNHKCDKYYTVEQDGLAQDWSGETNRPKFWQTMREWSRDNVVLISELQAPEDFMAVWEREVNRSMKAKEHFRATEKLFVYRGYRRD